MCGCISVVIKVEGISSQLEWLQTTAVAQYAKENKIDKLYGIAYGLDEINWARNTIHLVEEQWIKIKEFCKEKTIKPFLEDLKNIESLENTVENNFFK
jgi:CTP synthase (UTP-ammonia lyase)